MRRVDDEIAGYERSVLQGLTHLTAREREILGLMMAGLSSKRIAVTLGTSPRTVETHRAHILQKLGQSPITAVAWHLGRLSMFTDGQLFG